LNSNTYAKEELAGVWGGFGVQKNNGNAWTIKMNLSEKGYFIDYPSIPCGGELKLLSSSDNSYTFREVITKNINKCTNKGKLVIKLIDNNTLQWDWYYPNNGKLNTQTRVNRYQSNYDYEKKVPPLLAEYNRNKSNYNEDAAVLGVEMVI